MSWMQQTVRAAAESVSEPFERIAVAIRSYLAFFEEHPEYVELLIQERAIFRDRKRPTYFEYRAANLEYWRELYRQLIAAGQFRDDLPVERITDTIGSLLYGAMFTNHFVGRTVSLDEQNAALLADHVPGPAERRRTRPIRQIELIRRGCCCGTIPATQGGRGRRESCRAHPRKG